MTQKVVQLSTAQISKEVADFTVGLVKLIVRDGIEDASCAGSGTLVVIGGVGPMIIDRISVKQLGDGKELAPALIDLMPGGLGWVTFVRDISGRAFAASKDIDLISFEGDPNYPQFVEDRQRVRDALSKLRVEVLYHSIYGQKLVAERPLDWFGRHSKGDRSL